MPQSYGTLIHHKERVEGNNIVSPSTTPPEPWLPPVDISHLSPEQQQVVRGCYMRNVEHSPVTVMT